jgi:hypothetical protein
MASVKYIARMPEERRLAILTAFVKAWEILASMRLSMFWIC